jgi:hypothetical protein
MIEDVEGLGKLRRIELDANVNIVGELQARPHWHGLEIVRRE